MEPIVDDLGIAVTWQRVRYPALRRSSSASDDKPRMNGQTELRHAGTKHDRGLATP
jgi:hypothetical protein